MAKGKLPMRTFFAVVALCVVVVSGCESRPGPQGPAGPAGPRGFDGLPGAMGPPGAPGPSVTYFYHAAGATSASGVVAADCPSGTLAIGGGADCALCSGASSTAVLLAAQLSGNGFVAGCSSGCAHAVAVCISSSSAGTIVVNGERPDPQSLDDSLRAIRAAVDSQSSVTPEVAP